MGMAASQARYLELTARKTDVEYAGQQINQQRTSLSNESAGLFSQLMGLVVPTAPSSTDYTKTEYTFSDGNNTDTITSIKTKTGDPNNNATVTYSSTSSVYTGVAKTRTDLGINEVSGTYWLTDGSSTNPTNKTKLTQCTTTSTTATTDASALLQICKDNPTSSLATDLDYDSTNQKIDTSLIGNVYTYTSSDGSTYYYDVNDLDDAADKKGAATSLTGYYAANLNKTTSTTSDAYLTSSTTGRYSSITLAGTSTSFDLTATTTTNANAYNDAVNEYQYKQEVYQQQVNNINAKTSIIEQEDKVLELKLTQLDTEQKALSTEMDSVKKVIDKNIDQTFKTFSS